MRKLLITLAIIGLAFTAPTKAHAIFIVDTGAPPNFDNPIVLGSFDPNRPPVDLATKFTTSESYSFTDLEIWMEPLFGTLNISIYGDAGGPDTSNLFLDGQYVVNQQNLSPDWYGSHGLNTLIQSGTYWIAFESDTTDLFKASIPTGFLGSNDPPNPLNEYFTCNDVVRCDDKNNPSEWANISANKWGVRIQGNSLDNSNVVPEPSTMLLFGTGLLGAFVRRRKKF